MTMPDAFPLLATLEPHFVRLAPTDKNWNVAFDAAPGTSSPLPLAQLSTPVFTVGVSALEHNLRTMQNWIDSHGVLFAPHGKTSMSPALWAAQLEAGAWAITVANEAQLRVARAAGISRVVVANEFLSPHGLRWLAAQLEADDTFEVICWVDSVAAVEQMTRHLEAATLREPVTVCVELGSVGGRTGARDRATARAVADAVLASSTLRLGGISGYEGMIPATTPGGRVRAAREFLAEMAATFLEFAELFETTKPILTAGGSEFFDLVVDAFSAVRDTIPDSTIVLRSGCYVVHDDTLYTRSTPSASRTGPEFIAAAHVYARVLSVPEPGRALLDAGRRDVPYDAGLPVVQRILREGADGSARWLAAPPAIITAVNDQHAYLSFVDAPDDAHADTAADNTDPAAATDTAPFQVNDVVQLGLSHPCTMFDKWRSFVVIDDRDDNAPTVLGVLPTYF